MKFSNLKQYMAAIPFVYAASFSGDAHACPSGCDATIDYNGTATSYCSIDGGPVSDIGLTYTNGDASSLTGTTSGLSVTTNDDSLSLTGAVDTAHQNATSAVTFGSTNSSSLSLSNGLNTTDVNLDITPIFGNQLDEISYSGTITLTCG